MRVFVTGATGLVGGNLVRQLVQQGYTVRALVRSPEKARQLLGDTGAEVVQGDMTAVEGFAAQLKGCDVLFHTVAYFREYFQPGDHWRALLRINVDASLQLLETARRQGVGKVIYTSTSGVLGANALNGQRDESTPSAEPASMQNLYFKSKVLAERAINEWQQTSGVPVTHVLPSWIFGPSDAGPTAAGGLVLNFLNRRMPGIITRYSSVVDARDVAQTMINALERGRAGERYIASGGYYSLEQIAQVLEQVSGVPMPRMHIPYPAALTYAAFSELASRITGRPAMITLNAMRDTARKDLPVVATKAERELGVQFRPLEETLRDTVVWYRANRTELLRAASEAVAGTR